MNKVKTNFLTLVLLFISFTYCAPAFGEEIPDHTQAILSHAPTDAFSWEYEYQGTPNGLVGNPSPQISYYLKITSDVEYSVRMLLDGKVVNATYDEEANNLTYQTHGLVGTHEVEVQVDVYSQTKKITAWNFTIDASPILPFVGKNQLLLSTIQQEALTRMNEYRDALGIPRLTSSSLLQTAAQAHSNYLATNNVTGHGEIANKPGFTGINAKNRASYFGFSGGIGEGITYGHPTGALGMDSLLDAPYHRLSIIDPHNDFIGTGFNNVADLVVNYGNTRTSENKATVVMYPYNRQPDAKISWFAAENPNPLRFWGLDKVYVGYPISYTYYSSQSADQLIVKNASLKNQQQQAVPFYDVTPAREDSSNRHVFLIPKSPLQPGQTYTANVEAVSKAKDGSTTDVSRTWTFKTADSLAIHDIYFTKYNGFNFLSIDYDSGEDPNTVVTITQNDQLYMKIQNGQTWTYKKLTAGAYDLTIESPLFNETKKIAIELTQNKNPRFIEDGDWNVKFSKGSVVSDSTPPIISGVEHITLPRYASFNPAANVTAIDDQDGDITSSLTINGTVDTSRFGTYTVTYEAADRAGNVTTIKRIITIMDVVGLENFTLWQAPKAVDAHKPWVIRFNKTLDSKTVADDSIYVHYNQTKVPDVHLSINKDQQSITVTAPKNGYKSGQTYFLYVENSVQSIEGKKISQPIKYKFTIQ